jgi:transposase-like protein
MYVIAERPGQALIPGGDLALVVDGLWCTFQGRYWVLYNMAVKPVVEDVAYLLDPIQRCGRENAQGWSAAISTIPRAIKDRIRALISDGLPGFETIGQQQGWVSQFCHWHLTRSLESKLGRHRRQLGSRWLRERIYAAVCDALTTTDEHQLGLLEERLRQLIERWDCTRKLRWTVSQFLRLKDSFRAYLRHPDLRLPTTTGSLESLHNLLRVAIGTVNNPESALLRATAHLRLRQTITCNGRILQQN